MTLRWRILLGSSLLLVIPLLLLAIRVRSGFERRLSDQYTERIGSLMVSVEEDLARQDSDLGRRLAALARMLAADNRFWRALDPRHEELRPYLRDVAGEVMDLMGVDMLQIQDEQGLILSSGHFRNEFDRQEPDLPHRLATSGGQALLAWARRPSGPFLALCRLDSLQAAGRRLYLVGGKEIDPAFLARLVGDREVALTLVYPGGALGTDPELARAMAPLGREDLDQPDRALAQLGHFTRAIAMPLLVPEATAGRVWSGQAHLVLSHPRGPLRDLVRGLNLWLALLLVATLAGTLVLAAWLASRISRPLADLALQIETLDLDHLEADFPVERKDEVGVIARFLVALTARLRRSVERLREAERRATLGEMARQVHHDVRNGLAPLRNVVRHLGQLADRQSPDLPQVFQERRPTLESSLDYLGELADRYARLAIRPRAQPVDVGGVLLASVAACAAREGLAPAPGNAADGARVAGSPSTMAWSGPGPTHLELKLPATLPLASCDPTALRRLVENLVYNALESLSAPASAAGPDAAERGVCGEERARDAAGLVCVEAASQPAAAGQDPGRLVLKVSDTGPGIAPEDQERIFTDFYTTKPQGTGLGLSIVRRLVADCGGNIRLDSGPGRGTTFIVELPAAGDSLPAATKGGDRLVPHPGRR